MTGTLAAGRRVQAPASCAMVAAVTAEAWRHHPRTSASNIQWWLRDDITHPYPVLLHTLDGRGLVHATVLIPGKPGAEHNETACGRDLRWAAGMARVCWPEDGPLCQDCLSRVTQQ
ncbi:MAG: hypothetical protein ACRDZY_00020 [Acidimicrobiales bacterium]